MRDHRAARVPAAPLSLAAILAAEADLFPPPPGQTKGAPCDGLPPIYLWLNQCGHTALCLSGGGIRSAAFSLGVIQCLAAEGLAAAGAHCALGDVQYLSTVSGGGYIGAWLSAWLMRAEIDAKNQIGEGGAGVLDSLADTTAAPEARAIENVRVNSNYLTPKVGAMSADTWADVATYARNLLLNWLVVAPLVVCIVLLLKLLHWGQYLALTQATSLVVLPMLGIALLLMLIPLSFQSANRPTIDLMNVGQGKFLRLDLLVTLVAAVPLATSLYGDHSVGIIRDAIAAATGKPQMGFPFFGCCVIGALLYAVAWLAAPAWRRLQCAAVAAPRTRRRPRDFAAWTLAGAVFGVMLAIFWQVDLPLVLHAPTWMQSADQHLWGPGIIVVFGVPWVLFARNIAEVSFVALSSSWHRSDEDREWFARAAGWYIAALITCFVANALVLFASPIGALLGRLGSAMLAAAGGVSGLVTLLVGNSSLTAINPNENHRSQYARLSKVALTIATPVFACSLLIAVSAALDYLLLGTPFTSTVLFGGTETVNGTSPALILVIGAVVAALVGVVAGLCVDINQFSLHALYRDRLVRCFLAASRRNRSDRNLFTDFAHYDNPALHDLLQQVPPGAVWRPLHIINAALNIVSTRNLAWQERKAESFTFSPLHSGCGCIAHPSGTPGSGQTIGSYRNTQDYGRGIKLGTAMAISGAAVSPNMGYHSSPAVTFFMALFNVRLGWWLGNPGPAGANTFHRKGPWFATRPLIDETFGLTTDDHPYAYLSDGGHFDNLGLYEMVRRRCRFIVAVDADCDPDFEFADLGNAVRKIWLDHRVHVTFDKLHALRKRVTLPANPPLKAPYYTIGRIHYAEADGAPAQDGWILYLKPSLHGTEPVDVLAYAAANGSFPHETTHDQWFSESQFESYRALGFHQMSSVLDMAHEASPSAFRSLRQILETLARAAYGDPQPASSSSNSS